jgi:30S ribosomal protein S31
VPAGTAAGLFSLASTHQELSFMGKGDHRTRRGKIYQGSFGKSRPKDPAKQKKKAAKAAKR